MNYAAFLGQCTYYRRSVANFASVAANLYELTEKSKVYQWGELQEKAFQTLKDISCVALVLAYPVPRRKFILNSDASGCGIGGVLSQAVNGTEKVVGYYRRTQSKPERNWST